MRMSIRREKIKFGEENNIQKITIKTMEHEKVDDIPLLICHVYEGITLMYINAMPKL